MDERAATDSGKPVLLLHAGGHWSNPGRDLLGTRFDDMLSPERQAQIGEAVERLARFRATKVALEVAADKSDQMNEEYTNYRRGLFSLTADERHQLGYRLAAAFGMSMPSIGMTLNGRSRGKTRLPSHASTARPKSCPPPRWTSTKRAGWRRNGASRRTRRPLEPVMDLRRGAPSRDEAEGR